MLREIFLNLLYMTGIVTLVIIMFEVIKVPFEMQEKKERQKELEKDIDKFAEDFVNRLFETSKENKNDKTTKKN